MHHVQGHQNSSSAHIQQLSIQPDPAGHSSGSMQIAPGLSWQSRPVAAVVDWANIAVTAGTHRLPVPEKQLVGELRSEGASSIVAAARSFDPKTTRRLRAESVKTISFGDNADQVVQYYAEKFIRRGFAVIVVSGDGDLGVQIAAAAAASGVAVSFWSLRERLSRRLTCFPHRILDDIIPVRKRNDWEALTALSGARASGAVH